MTDEIKVGSRVRHESYGGGLVLDSKKFVKFDQFVSVSVVADKDLTLIPDTVTLSVELTRDELDHVSRWEPLGAPSSNYAHAKNKFIEAARALKETL
jgi:hypothetical protein